MATPEVFLLIDSNALIHRAFHAFPATLKTRSGEPTNAVYGFSSILLQVLKQFKPHHIVCAFDTAEATFREKEFPAYKANRPETDKLLVAQFPRVKDVVNAFGFPVIEKPGFEADDIIGSLVHDEHFKNFKKIIVTGDRDLLQLVDDDTQVFLSGSAFSQSALYDEAAVIKRFGFAPTQIIDFKALRGDSSDNIPGVAGIGDKTATDLIKEYGTLDDVYKNLDKLSVSVKNKLSAQKEQAYLSQRLATIDISMDIDHPRELFKLGGYDLEKITELFTKLEFRSLITKTHEVLGYEKQIAEKPQINIKTIKPREVTSSGIDQDLKNIAGATELVFVHVESAGTLFDTNGGLLIIDAKSNSWYFPGEIITKHAHDINNALQANSAQKITHDAKQLLHIFDTWGISSIKFDFDIMIASYLLRYESSGHDLKEILNRELGKDITEYNLNDVPQVNEIAFCIYEVYKNLSEELKNFDKGKWNLFQIFHKVEMPLVEILENMEKVGITLDVDYVKQFSKELEIELQKVSKEIYHETGHEFNIASPKQLSEILFTEMKLPSGKKGKSGSYSTNEQVLVKLALTYPIAKHILTYRELAKLQSTYTDSLIKLVNPKTNRIHTTYNQAVTATGRLSSTNPNLQNIPISSELGQKLRSAFVAGQNKLLISFDYSQQELRLLAHFSKEPKLIKAFKDNIDIHSLTASQIFNKRIEDVTKNERRAGKTVNFGVVYGISAFGLSERLGIPRDEGQAFIDSFYASYPNVRRYFDSILEMANTQGYVETILGKRKTAKNLHNLPFQAKAALERELINFPLQGSAADIMKLAMVRVYGQLGKYQDFVKLLLQIHDELVFEVDTTNKEEKRVKEIVELVLKDMKVVVDLEVPMAAEYKIGKNLGEV